jgi:hypothetical protein
MRTNEVEALQKQVVEKDVQLKQLKETLSDKVIRLRQFLFEKA